MADQVTTSTTSQPGWVQPYGQGFLDRAWDVAQTPYAAYQGNQVAGMNDWQQQGYQAQAQRAMDGSQTMGAANTALQGMYSHAPQNATANPYSGSNPYLQQNIDAAQGDLVRSFNNVQQPAYMNQAQRSGSFGNSGVTQANEMAQSDLQRNLGNVSSSMRMQDYNQQAQLAEQYAGRNDSMHTSQNAQMLQALGLAPSFAASDYNDINQLTSAGNAMQAQDQKGIDASYKQYLDSRGWDASQLGVMGTALGQAYGNTGSTTQTLPGVSTAASTLGGALTASQIWAMLSGGKP